MKTFIKTHPFFGKYNLFENPVTPKSQAVRQGAVGGALNEVGFGDFGSLSWLDSWD